MTPLRLLCVLLYGVLLLGLVTLNGALLALAIPLMIYLGAGLLYEPPLPQLTATRTLSSDRVSPAVPVAVKLALTNTGNRLEEVFVEDLFPPALELIDGSPRLLTALEPGATVEVEYTLRGQRGIYHFPGVQVTASEYLGLFRKRLLLPATSQLFILPEVARMRRVDIRPRQTRVYSGFIPARQGGPGVEFFGVREYQPGDPTRWINARATARATDSLFVNEFEQERVADVGLILDGRALSDVRTRTGSLFEHGVQAAAAMADALIGQGNRVGLLIYGNGADWTLPGYGKLQRERILRALARAKTADLPAFESLELMPIRVFPARSQLVLISPLLERDLPVLVRLRARQYQLIVISPDPVSFEQESLGMGKPVELAGRIARVERKLLLRKLQQVGIAVVDWHVDTPFHHVTHVALSRSPQAVQGPGIGS
jgi:uncharacterized protein (DUF58 family)